MNALKPMELQTGIELDVLVAEQLMQWPRIGENDPYRLYLAHGGVVVDDSPQKFPDNGGTIPSAWRPSTRLDHAVLVAERLREDGWLVVMKWMPAESCFSEGLGIASEYDHKPQPEPRRVLKGAVIVELLWMDNDGWDWPMPEIVHADTPALAICRAAVGAQMAIEEWKVRNGGTS